MATYYIATLARYVLVDAANEADARELGYATMLELYADVRQRLGKEVPITIHTVRLATDDEIEFWREHQNSVAREGG